jgi:hypothetical protein
MSLSTAPRLAAPFARISASESELDVVGDYANPAALDHALARIAARAPEGGAYDKTYVTLFLEDGATYEARIDVTRKGTTIENHLRTRVNALRGPYVEPTDITAIERLVATTQSLEGTLHALRAVLAAKAAV